MEELVSRREFSTCWGSALDECDLKKLYLYDQFEGQKACSPPTSQFVAHASSVSGSCVSIKEFVRFDPRDRLDLFTRLFHALFEFVGEKFVIQGGGARQVGLRRSQAHSA